jgi:hypothetical protein
MGQVAPLFSQMPCRAERTLILPDLATNEKLLSGKSRMMIIADTSKL